MAALTIYAARKLLDHLFGKTALTMPTPYIGLLKTNPSDDAGTGIAEADYTGYARVSLSSLLAAATSATPSLSTNSSAVTFGANSGSSQTITGFGIWDASSAGNLLWWDTCSLVVSTGVTPSFATGDLDMTLG